ncbi:MAG: TCR/Tet family MFS transporter [Flavobacteriales bacterium]|jgi:DHA1 family tetracycline resistance protein-like MFS transporter
MPRNQNAALTFIFITLLIDVIGIGIIIPVLPKLIVEVGGGGMSDAALMGGLLISAFSVMQFIFSPFLGNLSDHYGRRPILLISLFGFGLDYILMAFAPTLGWLFVGRIIAGIMGASFTTASAYIADVSAPEKRAQNFGLIGAAFGLGFIIGPFLGGWLGQYGTRVPFIGAAILTLLNWLFGFFILPESLPEDKRRKFDVAKVNPFNAFSSIAKFPVILGLVASLIVIYIASHATQSTWSFFTIERFQWSEKEVGYSLAVVGILVSIVQGLLIRVINPRLGAERSVYVGIILYAIGFFLFSFANTGWMMFVFLIPYCLGGISGPALQGIMSSQVPDNQQGELQGALTSLISITSIVGPLIMTSIFAYFTKDTAFYYFPGAAFFLGGVLTLISGYLAYRTLKKHR